MRWEELEQQPCSLARTLSVVGDRWTLLVLRESFLGIRRFDAFEKRLGITRHVLADRLKKLAEAGVLDKVAYQQRPLREEYCLSAKGRDLYPASRCMAYWCVRTVVSRCSRVTFSWLKRQRSRVSYCRRIGINCRSRVRTVAPVMQSLLFPPAEFARPAAPAAGRLR